MTEEECECCKEIIIIVADNGIKKDV